MQQTVKTAGQVQPKQLSDQPKMESISIKTTPPTGRHQEARPTWIRNTEVMPGGRTFWCIIRHSKIDMWCLYGHAREQIVHMIWEAEAQECLSTYKHPFANPQTYMLALKSPGWSKSWLPRSHQVKEEGTRSADRKPNQTAADCGHGWLHNSRQHTPERATSIWTCDYNALLSA